jgi:hypothetical protein
MSSKCLFEASPTIEEKQPLSGQLKKSPDLPKKESGEKGVQLPPIQASKTAVLIED